MYFDSILKYFLELMFFANNMWEVSQSMSNQAYSSGMNIDL